MPITLDPLVLSGDVPGLVRAGLPALDGCPILTRLKAFIVDQGADATLEHVFRDRQGNPVDLSTLITGGGIALRVKEFLGAGLSPVSNPTWSLTGSVVDLTGGIVRCALPADLVEQAGIYELAWGAVGVDGRPLSVDRGLLSIERSQFATDEIVKANNLGPPTLQEVRMRLMDSAASENLLLDDIEFKAEQIQLALVEPIRLFNESPPPIGTFTTRTFPWRGAWTSGVLAQLYFMAAANYRRNYLEHQAGGINVADKKKFNEYGAEGKRLWDEYRAWMDVKKCEINLKLFSGELRSVYSYRSTDW